MTGTVIKLIAGDYTVMTEEGPYCCRAKGSFRREGVSPVPGDQVRILALPDRSGRIEEILPRRNYLIRPNTANVDVLCYVSSFGSPSPFPYTIDKMLVIASFLGITPVLVFNKTDQSDPETDLLAELYLRLGYPVFKTSAQARLGLEELKRSLLNKTVIFAGNTGVGKSSLLNALYPDLQLKTGEISEKLGRGRHTTRHSELFPSNGALIGDTPGFGALELDGYAVKRQELAGFFPEFFPFLAECGYQDCSHIHEQACAIRTAVEQGAIASSRYESYRQMYQFFKEGETPWNKKPAKS